MHFNMTSTMVNICNVVTSTYLHVLKKMNSQIYIKFRINFSTLANMLAADSLRIPQVTIPRRCFFCGSYSLFFFSLFHTAMSVFAVL